MKEKVIICINYPQETIEEVLSYYNDEVKKTHPREKYTPFFVIARQNGYDQKSYDKFLRKLTSKTQISIAQVADFDYQFVHDEKMHESAYMDVCLTMIHQTPKCQNAFRDAAAFYPATGFQGIDAWYQCEPQPVKKKITPEIVTGRILRWISPEELEENRKWADADHINFNKINMPDASVNLNIDKGQLKEKTEGKLQKAVRERIRYSLKDYTANSPKFLDFSNEDTFMELTAFPVIPKNRRIITVTEAYIQDYLVQNTDENITVSILANAYHSGSAFCQNPNVQEEAALHFSDAIWSMPESYPNLPHRHPNNPYESGLLRLGGSYRISVQPYILNPDNQKEAKRAGKRCNYVFTAALNLQDQTLDTYCRNGGADEFIRHMAFIIRSQCEHALLIKSPKLVLGAMGCGQFSNNPYLVAAICQMVLNEPKYADLQTEFVISGKELFNIFTNTLNAPPEEIQEIIEIAPTNKQDISRWLQWLKGGKPSYNSEVKEVNYTDQQQYIHQRKLAIRGQLVMQLGRLQTAKKSFFSFSYDSDIKIRALNQLINIISNSSVDEEPSSVIKSALEIKLYDRKEDVLCSSGEESDDDHVKKSQKLYLRWDSEKTIDLGDGTTEMRPANEIITIGDALRYRRGLKAGELSTILADAMSVNSAELNANSNPGYTSSEEDANGSFINTTASSSTTAIERTYDEYSDEDYDVADMLKSNNHF